jgi:hypothetical protein
MLFTNTEIVLASISICIALLVLTPNKQSAHWVFTTVMDGSGWGSRGFSFLLGYVYRSNVYRRHVLNFAVSSLLHGQ